MPEVIIERLLQRDITPFPLNKLQRQYKHKIEQAIASGEIALQERNSCICGSSEHHALANVDRFGLDFPSRICKSCGLVFTSPHLAGESLPAYYQSYYHPLTFGTPQTNTPLFCKGQGGKIFSLTQAHLPGSGTLKIFELGAASGSNLLEFTQAASKAGVKTECFGLEYNTQLVEHGRKQGLKLDDRSLDDYVENSGETFDLVILSHVFEHFVDIGQQLALLKQISGPDTLFYIEVPGIMNLRNGHFYDYDFLKYLTHAHIFNFNLRAMEAALAQFGFSLVYGNERVETIFKQSESPVSVDASKNYAELCDFLKKLEVDLPELQRKNPTKRSLPVRILRKIKKTIFA